MLGRGNSIGEGGGGGGAHVDDAGADAVDADVVLGVLHEASAAEG